MRDALETARLAAAAGGAVLQARVADPGTVRSKSSATDFVSEADIASGVATVRTIVERHPGACVVVEEPEVCEELGIAPGGLDDALVWVVDPLDGTTSFLHGYPCYSVSVALLADGRPVAGAVMNAASGELFSAAEGTGAWRDNQPIRCTSAHSIREALLITGFPYDRTVALDRQLAVLADFLRTPVHGIRRDGSAAIDCCHVASGRADGFWEFGLQPWDTAAGAIICSEAGATVTALDGSPWSVNAGGICVAGAQLHAAMLELIGAHL